MINVLIVEDEPELLATYKGEVSLLPECTVLTASDVTSAIHIINSDRVDLVITDLRMSKDRRAGVDVLRAAKDRDPLTQVIVVTVFGTPELSVEIMSLGAFDYLQRNSPVVDFYPVLQFKMAMALRFRDALLFREAHTVDQRHPS